MSTEKITAECFFLDETGLLDRLKEISGLKKDKEIARLLGISAPDFSNRKRRRSLSAVATEWALENGHDVAWLIYGQKGPTVVDPSIPPQVAGVIREAQTGYNSTPLQLTAREFSMLVLFRQMSAEQQDDAIMMAGHLVEENRQKR